MSWRICWVLHCSKLQIYFITRGDLQFDLFQGGLSGTIDILHKQHEAKVVHNVWNNGEGQGGTVEH